MEQIKYAIPTSCKLEKIHRKMLRQLGAKKIIKSNTRIDHYLKFIVPDESSLIDIKRICCRIGLKLYSHATKLSEKELIDLN